MKPIKRVIELDPYEYGAVLHSLNDKRNQLLSEQRSTDVIDELLIKVYDAPNKKERQRDDGR